MKSATTYKFTTGSALTNIGRIVELLAQPMTRREIEESICRSSVVVWQYLRFLQSDPARVVIVGNRGRAPVYQSVLTAKKEVAHG